MGAVELGQLIKQTRLGRGMTQDQLAARIGTVGSYVSQIEAGVRKWPQQYIAPLADTLGLDEVDMLIAAGVISPRPDRPVKPAESVNDRLIAQLRDVTLNEERVHILKCLFKGYRDFDRAQETR